MFANVLKKLYQHNLLLNNFTFPSFICPKNKTAIDFRSPVFMIGSCFSENISAKLVQRKIDCFSNPSGILFDVLSIENTIKDIVDKRAFTSNDLFLSQEIYHSWSHHSDFSDMDANQAVNRINHSSQLAFEKLKQSKFIILTLGSAFSYFHIDSNRFVANCHKVPQKEFRKELISSDRIHASLLSIQSSIRQINPDIQFILTISPVRHLRDGMIENNRSKARLIEAVHRFVLENDCSYYFPSYEIVIDLLRDYRYFDIDFAHPNYQATDIVFQYFKQACIDEKIWGDIENFHHLYLSTKHRSRNPDTMAHQKFLHSQLKITEEYQASFPYLDFSYELNYFKNDLKT